MNIQVDFPADIEQTLQQLALASGVDVATIVRTVVTEKLEEELKPAESESTHESFKSRLQAIVDLHPASTGHVDDSRESIYAGRGE